MVEVDDARRVEQANALHLWRRRRLIELGLTRYQAERLAEQGCDWHEAAALVAAGCPAELVFDLLSF